jgi:F-type H+-transporting ATPase subunit a
MIIFSPIEQYNLLVIGHICSGFSNLAYSFLIIVFIFYFGVFVNFNLNIINNSINNIGYFFFMKVIKKNNKNEIYFNTLHFIPSFSQYFFENLLYNILKSYKNLINSYNLYIFYNTILTSVFFILFANIVGLIPYGFTITAQIFITFNLAILLFIIFNIIGFLKHNFNMINLVIPTGIHISLHFLLIPIEMISYIFRPISLSIRLFANIMAGHTLLKVICGFIYKFFNLNISIILSILPFLLITSLYFLESFVAVIQTYVFFILSCLFLKDILNLNH